MWECQHFTFMEGKSKYKQYSKQSCRLNTFSIIYKSIQTKQCWKEKPVLSGVLLVKKEKCSNEGHLIVALSSESCALTFVNLLFHLFIKWLSLGFFREYLNIPLCYILHMSRSSGVRLLLSCWTSFCERYITVLQS